LRRWCGDNKRATSRFSTTSSLPTWSTTRRRSARPGSLKQILRTIEADLGSTTLEQHHVIGDDNLVAQYLTLRGTHWASTMPLLAGVPVTGRRAAWTFIYVRRAANGMLVENWDYCKDMSLLEQLRG
jgi:hypothetical protein